LQGFLLVDATDFRSVVLQLRPSPSTHAHASHSPLLSFNRGRFSFSPSFSLGSRRLENLANRFNGFSELS